MPFYDRLCQSCGWVKVDSLEAVYASAMVCPDCSQSTERVWLTAPPNVIGDECDFVSNNGARHPMRFRSKGEHKRWLREHHFMVKDEAVPGDKHTKTWSAGGKQWLADAEALAMRNGTASGNTPEEDASVNVTWSEGIATPEMVARFARK